jgi:hypothetical protein
VHSVFLSYFHEDDQYDKDRFEELFGHLFINESVQSDDINTDVSTEYIKRLIQEDYISDSSVVLVLVGVNTWKRKHVDWEISAGLNKKVEGYSGLLGILLPDFPLSSDGKYSYDDIPPRLADNVKSKYAKIYTWDWVCADESRIKSAIDSAFDSRVSEKDKIDNSRPQFINNRI